MLSLDATTRLAYDQGTSTTGKIAAIIAALPNPVTVTVLNGSGTSMGSGTMSSPWAIANGNVLDMGDLASFTITSTATPDTNWRIRFSSGSRWVEGSFGLTGSGKDFIWSRPTWAIGQVVRFGAVEAYTFKGAAEKDVADFFNIVASVGTVSWISTASKSLGTFYAGDVTQYDLKQDAVLPQGTSPRFTLLSGGAIGISVDQFTGILQVSANAAIGGYSLVVQLSNGAQAPTNKSYNFSVASQTIGAGNWETRISGPGVVWYHNFTHEAELLNFIRLPNDYAARVSAAPGGYSLNRNIDINQHDPVLRAHWVQDPGVSSGRCVEITNIGSTLASDVDTTQMYIDLVDASAFPDPADDPRKYYWLAIQADENDPGVALWHPDAPHGNKGVKECVTVQRKEGNRLILAGRGHSYGESASGGGYAPKPFLAGTPVGQDSDGGWNRPLAPLAGTLNGRGIDDPAALGTLAVRTNFVPGTQAQDFVEGMYAQPFYKQFSWPESAFDGEEVWIQWRVKFSLTRNAPMCPSGKQLFIDLYPIASNQEWVTGGPGWKDKVGKYVIDNNVKTYTNFASQIAPDVEYDWALGEWQTVLCRLRSGYAQDQVVPMPGKASDTYDSLTVDTTAYTPNNKIDTLTSPGEQGQTDGVRRLRFETSIPPLYPWLPSINNPGPNGETTNRHDNRYWNGGGWQMTWPVGAPWLATVGPAVGTQFSGGTAVVERAEVINGRMRWTFVKRGSSSMTTGVPSHGHKMQMTTFDRALAYPPEYLRHEWDLWVKRDGQAPVQVYNLRNYITPFGESGIGVIKKYPPGYNTIQMTGYGNIWDNLAPRAATTTTRFGDMIVSKQPIPWPED